MTYLHQEKRRRIMHSNKSSLILSDKVEATLSDAVANLKLLVKELVSGSGNASQMEVEKLMLQAEKVELEAAKLELESGRAQFKAQKLEFEATWSSSRPDPKLESEKAALKAERLQLEAEKTQLRVAQVNLKAAQLQLEDAKSELETAQSKLDQARAQLETALTHLEAAKAEAAVDSKRLEAAKASLEAATARLTAATRQLNAAKSRFEAAKTLLDAAAANEADHSANLQIRVSELEAEKLTHKTTICLLQKDKLDLTAEVDSLTVKVREAEKKLDQCCKDKAKVFLDIKLKGGREGRVVIKLDYDNTPLTAEKFRVLCTRENGIDPYYKGKRLTVFTGAIATENTADSNMYGSNFPQEILISKHAQGVVSLAYYNGKVYQNRFLISTANNPYCEGKYVDVVFGHVVEGMDLVMEMASARGGSVIECGQLS